MAGRSEAVCQPVGSGPVRSGASRSVTDTPSLHGPGRNYDHLETGLKEGVDHRPVGAFDRRSANPRPVETTAHVHKAVAAIGHLELFDHHAVAVDDVD